MDKTNKERERARARERRQTEAERRVTGGSAKRESERERKHTGRSKGPSGSSHKWLCQILCELIVKTFGARFEHEAGPECELD